MKFNRITFNIIILAVLMISLNNCKKKEVETEIISKVAYLDGGYKQTCTYNFDISSFSFSKVDYMDTVFTNLDTLTLVYNNFDTIYINDTTFFYNKIYMTDTTGSEVVIKQTPSESDIIVKPHSVLQVTFVCNIDEPSYANHDILYSDSLPVFTYKPFSGSEGVGIVEESDDVTFSGNFYGGSDMDYMCKYSVDSSNYATDSTKVVDLTGTFEGEIQVNFEFYFNGNLIDTKSLTNVDISNGEFNYRKLY